MLVKLQPISGSFLAMQESLLVFLLLHEPPRHLVISIINQDDLIVIPHLLQPLLLLLLGLFHQDAVGGPSVFLASLTSRPQSPPSSFWSSFFCLFSFFILSLILILDTFLTFGRRSWLQSLQL